MPVTMDNVSLQVQHGRVAVHGALVRASARHVAETVRWQVRHHAVSQLTLDLSDVDEIDIEGVRALIAARRTGASHGIDVILESPSDVVIRALQKAHALRSLRVLR